MSKPLELIEQHLDGLPKSLGQIIETLDDDQLSALRDKAAGEAQRRGLDREKFDLNEIRANMSEETAERARAAILRALREGGHHG